MVPYNLIFSIVVVVVAVVHTLKPREDQVQLWFDGLNQVLKIAKKKKQIENAEKSYLEAKTLEMFIPQLN